MLSSRHPSRFHDSRFVDVARITIIRANLDLIKTAAAFCLTGTSMVVSLLIYGRTEKKPRLLSGVETASYTVLYLLIEIEKD